ncbi:hypothetical protein AVEN_60985-1 [Araneus ventricosus]|uniref:CCHC-type domain-containing protein n=1 Tax=Araneus ventricosus TaxID=182803 RepID=A0A4Y2DBQ7_ARAVE|nr:hypothetical protein AVEN_60985-1 [Araneus ventricosus]
MKLAVRTYIPNPLICFQCQRFGHSKASCRWTLICTCYVKTSQEKCVNCKGSHSSFSRSCSSLKFEKEVVAEKVIKQITYAEAKRQVHQRAPIPETSYATAMKNTLQAQSTQILPAFVPSVTH